MKSKKGRFKDRPFFIFFKCHDNVINTEIAEIRKKTYKNVINMCFDKYFFITIIHVRRL